MVFSSFNTFISQIVYKPPPPPPRNIYSGTRSTVGVITTVVKVQTLNASSDGAYVIAGSINPYNYIMVYNVTGTAITNSNIYSITPNTASYAVSSVFCSASGNVMVAQTANNTVYVNSSYGVSGGWVNIGVASGGVTLDYNGANMYWSNPSATALNVVYYVSNPASVTAGNIASATVTLTPSGGLTYYSSVAKVSGNNSTLYISGFLGSNSTVSILKYDITTNTLTSLGSSANYNRGGNMSVNYNGSTFMIAGSSYLIIGTNYGTTITLSTFINGYGVNNIAYLDTSTSGMYMLIGGKTSGAGSSTQYLISNNYGATWKSTSIANTSLVKICADGSLGYLTTYNAGVTTVTLYSL